MNRTIPRPVQTWLQENGFGEVTDISPVGGGCINNGSVLRSQSGNRFFLKTNSNPPAEMFIREAEGLEALSVTGGPRVPKPFFVGEDFLLLEDLSPGPQAAGYWSAFGQQIAVLHNHTNTHFGFTHDNYIGSTPQQNPWVEDGVRFFAEQRLIFQARLANQRGLLGSSDLTGVERLAARLAEFIPTQPASLIHGDLWSGNALTDENGNPAIIDPAAHYGWAEADLAMTNLFGSFPGEFYRAYQEVRPLDDGYRERFGLYNLYHLLNHLNLFGGSYLGQVRSILQRYSR
jgi:protein-ribulosamine 3-kinase